MKNLKRALRYLAVWDEPVIPADDMGPARSLSYAEEGTESEARERARKRRTREDGVGSGKGMPDGRRRNRNTQECPSGEGPGLGLGDGKGRGKNRLEKAIAQLQEYRQPSGYDYNIYTWEEVQPNAPKWKEVPFDISLVKEFGYEPNEDLTAMGELIEQWKDHPAGSLIILDIERGLDETPHPLGDFMIIKEEF